ncbi:VOC family protein [Qipengyuania spongiae]|uniref:VOC family protein n=1 Tax=Qipengyuania spongiae TaxID=2909673 RepID=A0ABY5T3A6_9SPHN|nr:VOC family protein [Qipengyuania spongiae]UVI39771.1 VOC family protein [Qipengyuania spongiae]
MLGYVTVGTNDLERAARFYDAIAAEMGVGRMMEFDTFIAWGEMHGAPGIAATRPYDGKAATVGNGMMVALEASSKEQVHRLHEIALAKGGSDEGAPGPRGEPDASGTVFYAAYFRDPDGNKLNAFLMAPGA